MSERDALKMDAAAIEAFLQAQFPQAAGFGAIESLEPGKLRFCLETSEAHLRPGGTVSGPTLMTMADTAAYYLLLAHLGPVALAVTTNLNIDFLRKGPPGTAYAEATLLKLGRRLALCQVGLFASDGGGTNVHVAQATVTYALPSR